MQRRGSLAGILLLTVGPLPLVAWLGHRGIRSLEERHLELGRAEALAALGRDLAGDLDALRRERGDEAGSLRETSVRFTLRGEDLGHDAVTIRAEPQGEALAHPDLLRAHARGAAGRWVEALEALEGTLRDPDPRTKALGTLAAADAMRALDRPERAIELAERAAGLLAEEESQAWRRWAEVHRRRLVEGLEPALEAAAGWVEEIDARATDLEELVLVGHALRPLPADDPRVRSLRERIAERRSRPQWRRRLAQRSARATPGSIPILVRIAPGWFLVERDPEPTALRVGGLDAWLTEWRGPQGERAREADEGSEASAFVQMGAIRRPGLPVDLGELALRITSGETSPFGAWNPRWLLGAGLAAYALLALLALRAFRNQERHARRLATLRGDLIAEVTHELRTPLTVLRMYSESLAENRIAPEAVPEYVTTIQREAMRLGGIVDHVAEAARGETLSGAERALIDPQPVLDRLAADFGGLVEAGGGSVELEAPSDTARVHATEEELRRIFEILLDNALRYSPPPARVRLRVEVDGDSWIATVRDRGTGIPAEERERVFERWVRGRGSRALAGGAGMGLYLAREGARRLGGDLTLEFPSDGGTRARVVLPGVRPLEEEA